MAWAWPCSPLDKEQACWLPQTGERHGSREEGAELAAQLLEQCCPDSGEHRVFIFKMPFVNISGLGFFLLT